MSKRAKIPAALWNRYVRLLSDHRMREAWQWYERIRTEAPSSSPLRFEISDFLAKIDRALNFPKKPADLTNKQREKYFESVRKHAESLAELLEGTRFSDTAVHFAKMQVVEFEDAASAAADAASELKPHCLEDYEHVVTYVVGEDTVQKMPATYPLSNLYDLLVDVVRWTYSSDGWNHELVTSKYIESAHSDTKVAEHFVLHLYFDYKRIGIEIPHAHLATIASVALELPASRELDAESAGQKIKRYKVKLEKDRQDEGIPF